MVFAIPADHRVKLKERAKKIDYMDLAMERKSDHYTNCNCTVAKGLVKTQEDLEMRERVETIQTAALLRLVSILRGILEIEEICCHSKSIEIPSANADGKISQVVIIIIKIQVKISFN